MGADVIPQTKSFGLLSSITGFGDSVLGGGIAFVLACVSLSASFWCALFGLAAAFSLAAGEMPELLSIPPFSSMVNYDVFAEYCTSENKKMAYGTIALLVFTNVFSLNGTFNFYVHMLQ